MDKKEKKQVPGRGDPDDRVPATSSPRLLGRHWADAPERIPSRRSHWWRPGAIIPWLIAGVVALLVSLFVFDIVSRVLARPFPEVVAVGAENNEPGLYYTVWVRCTVRNSGGDGSVIVTATLEGGGMWALERTSFLARGEEKRLVVAFSGVAYLEEGISGYHYDCRVRPRGFRWGRSFY